MMDLRPLAREPALPCFEVFITESSSAKQFSYEYRSCLSSVASLS